MKISIVFFGIILPFLAVSQTHSKDSLGLTIAPGLTPVIANNQNEIGFFNTAVTYRTDDTSSYRAAQLGNFLQLQRGISRQNRLSAGVDWVFSNLRFGPASEVAPFAVLGPTPSAGIAAHTLSALGLRVRYVPFIRHYEFTVQSALYFPIAAPQNRGILGEDRTRLSVQGNYSTLFAPGWYVVAQLSPQVRFSNNTRKQTTWELPLNAYLIRRIYSTASGQGLYAFANMGYFSSFEKGNQAGLRQANWLFSAGAGTQWAFGPQWSLSLGWQALPAYNDTTNIRKGSYAALSLGARYVGAR